MYEIYSSLSHEDKWSWDPTLGSFELIDAHEESTVNRRTLTQYISKQIKGALNTMTVVMHLFTCNHYIIYVQYFRMVA